MPLPLVPLARAAQRRERRVYRCGRRGRQYRVSLLHRAFVLGRLPQQTDSARPAGSRCRGRRHQLGHRPGRKTGRIHADLLPRRPRFGVRGRSVPAGHPRFRRAARLRAGPAQRHRAGAEPAVARRVCRPRLYPRNGCRESRDADRMQGRGYENARIRLRRLCRGAAGRCAGRWGEPGYADEAHVKLQEPLRPLDGPDARTARRRLVDHALRRSVSLLRIHVP